jgi:HECT-domain (ubiquitin-transferase)
MQVAAFRAGFEEVFPLHSLNAFYEDEIEAMLCGTGAALTPRTAACTCVVDTHSCSATQTRHTCWSLIRWMV